MKGEIRPGICAIAAAVVLVACASKSPVSSTGTAAQNAGAGGQNELSAEYQRLVDNATDQRICKRQAVTGTRVDRVVCTTRAEMEEAQRNADEVMREMRNSAAVRQQMPMPQPQTPPPSPPR